MRVSNEDAIEAAAVTGTDVVTSSAIPADSFFNMSVQAVTSGSNPNGALKVQFSNDNPQYGAPASWSDVGSATVSTTNNGVYKIDKFDICAMFVRLVYTNASGSGVITARYKLSGV